jgi:hypothetical protein
MNITLGQGCMMFEAKEQGSTYLTHPSKYIKFYFIRHLVDVKCDSRRF